MIFILCQSIVILELRFRPILTKYTNITYLFIIQILTINNKLYEFS